MPQTVPPQCTHIANEIDVLEEELRGLQEELELAPPELKTYYRREIKRVNRELGLRRQALSACEEHHDPPALRPDLFAYGVSAIPNHATKRLLVAAIVKNIGKAPAVGPFRIDIAVTAISGNFQRSHVQAFEVPAGLVIYAEIAQEGTPAKIPGGGVGNPYKYVTEKMDVPLLYLDENPSYKYEIEFLVDVENQVSESNEENNSFKTTRWYLSTGATQRDKPFIIGPPEASSTEGPNY